MTISFSFFPLDMANLGHFLVPKIPRNILSAFLFWGGQVVKNHLEFFLIQLKTQFHQNLKGF
jgi:hypothetical protein